MKKLLMIIVLGLFLLPSMVFALEDQGDVTYFLEYPNDIEVVLDDYIENMEDRLELIYEGTTNDEGQVVVEDLPENVELRVIEYVPTGNTYEPRSQDINLENGTTVTFTNNKVTNPTTNVKNFYWLFVLLGVVTIGRLIQTKKWKKILPVLLIVLSIVTVSKVKAEGTDLVVKVKDENGKAISGIKVEVYAKPLNIEYSPAIKISAGDGYFFDGLQTMYVRYNPSSELLETRTIEEVINKASNSEYIWANIDNSYKVNAQDNGYLSNDVLIDTVHNGEIELTWELCPEINEYCSDTIYTIDGNGQEFDFYGKTMSTVKSNNWFRTRIIASRWFYDTDKINNIEAQYYLTGYDNNKNCNNQFGFNYLEEDDVADTIYMCWAERTDGIYITGIRETFLYPGNITDKYHQSGAQFIKAGSQINARIKLFNLYDSELSANFLNNIDNFTLYSFYSIKGITIIENGETIINIPEIYLSSSCQKGCSTTITDNKPREELYNYFCSLATEIQPGWDK